MFPINNNLYSPSNSVSHYTRANISSASAPEVPSAPRTAEQYYSHWAEWEKNTPPGGGEKRDIAVAKIRYCFEKQLPALDLSENNLSSLPEYLPPHIRELNISENRLTKLPDNFPAELKFIDAYCNQIKEISVQLPSKLTLLDLEFNCLETIPDNLPDTLKVILLAENDILYLPQNLPSDLSHLCLRNNKLSTIPGNLMQLGSHVTISAHQNPFSEQTLCNLREQIQSEFYSGPQISVGSGVSNGLAPRFAQTRNLRKRKFDQISASGANIAAPEASPSSTSWQIPLQAQARESEIKRYKYQEASASPIDTIMTQPAPSQNETSEEASDTINSGNELQPSSSEVKSITLRFANLHPTL